MCVDNRPRADPIVARVFGGPLLYLTVGTVYLWVVTAHPSTPRLAGKLALAVAGAASYFLLSVGDAAAEEVYRWTWCRPHPCVALPVDYVSASL